MINRGKPEEDVRQDPIINVASAPGFADSAPRHKSQRFIGASRTERWPNFFLFFRLGCRRQDSIQPQIHRRGAIMVRPASRQKEYSHGSRSLRSSEVDVVAKLGVVNIGRNQTRRGWRRAANQYPCLSPPPACDPPLEDVRDEDHPYRTDLCDHLGIVTEPRR